MRTVVHITMIFSLLLGLASCYSEKMLVDDDVYIVQSNKLPIGESLNDQTSYEAFKRQNQSGATKAAYYQNSQNYLYNSNCWGYFSMYNPCGCGFYAMNIYNPYHPLGMGFNGGFGNPYFGMMSPYYNPYYDNNSPFGFGNSFGYGNPYGFGNPFGYGSPYGLGNPYAYGYGNGAYYSGGSLINQPVGPQVGGVHYSGPRGSISGYIPNSQRNNPNVLKSANSNGSAYSGATTFNRPSQQIARTVIQPSVERPTYTPTVSRGVQQQTTSGGTSPIRNTGGINPSNQGTSQPVNNQRVVPQQNQQQPQIQRGGGGGNTPTPARSTGGGTGVRRN
jgi:hypothetical protein